MSDFSTEVRETFERILEPRTPQMRERYERNGGSLTLRDLDVLLEPRYNRSDLTTRRPRGQI